MQPNILDKTRQNSTMWKERRHRRYLLMASGPIWLHLESHHSLSGRSGQYGLKFVLAKYVMRHFSKIHHCRSKITPWLIATTIDSGAPSRRFFWLTWLKERKVSGWGWNKRRNWRRLKLYSHYFKNCPSGSLGFDLGPLSRVCSFLSRLDPHLIQNEYTLSM